MQLPCSNFYFYILCPIKGAIELSITLGYVSGAPIGGGLQEVRIVFLHGNLYPGCLITNSLRT